MLRDLDAVHARHSDVNECDIGGMFRNLLEGVFAGAGLTDDLEASGFEKETNSGADQGLMVGNHDPQR
jgi:hypothetical protein